MTIVSVTNDLQDRVVCEAAHENPQLIQSNHLTEANEDDDIPMEAVFNVHLGITNWCLPNRRQQILQIAAVHIHPEYLDFMQSDVSADLAVLVLRKETRDFRPVCLPFNGSSRSPTTIQFSFLSSPHISLGEHSRRGHVLGFGLTQFTFNNVVCALREIFVDIFSPIECQRNANPSSYNSRDTICAGITAGGIDACQVSDIQMVSLTNRMMIHFQGDSGGLLQIKNEKNEHFIVGIVSFGDACALRNRPGIYTNVTYHLPWILNVCRV